MINLVTIVLVVLLHSCEARGQQSNISTQLTLISTGNVTRLNRQLIRIQTELPNLNWTSNTMTLTAKNAQLIMTQQNSTGNGSFAAPALNYSLANSSASARVFAFELVVDKNVTKNISPQKKTAASHVAMVTPATATYAGLAAYTTANTRALQGSVTYVTNNVTISRMTCKRLKVYVTTENLKLPPQIKLKVIGLNRVCAYVDPVTYQFSTVGCSTRFGASGAVVCQCNHPTVLTTLVSIQTASIPSGVKILSYVLESISIFGIVVTLSLLLIYKTDDRSVIQINLSIALIFVHVTNITQDIGARSSGSCVFEAFIFHVFLLSTAMFLMLDAIRVCASINNPQAYMVGSQKHRNIMFMVVGWMTSFLIAAIAVGAGTSDNAYLPLNPLYIPCHTANDTLAQYNTCRCAPGTSAFAVAIVVPIVLCWLVTMAALGKAKWTRLYGTPEQGVVDEDKVRFVREVDETIKSILILSVIFGLAWIFGFASGFGDVMAPVPLLYLYTISVGVQGLSIPVVYCACDATFTMESE